MKHPSRIPISDFTYELPPEKIAVYPLEQRDASKLLVYKNEQISESTFRRVDEFLEAGSLLVFNNTKVIRARLNFLNAKGQGIEIFCLEPNAPGQDLAAAMAAQKTIRWNCLVGNLKRWKDDELKLSKEGFTLTARIIARELNYVIIEFLWEPAALCFAEVLEKLGNLPIPPYLKREDDLADSQRYQTVYAKHEGSVAAPTAGLHFTPAVFTALGNKQVASLSVTLHVGAGTFKPVKSETMEGHDMHAEWIDVDIETIKQVLLHGSKKIIAVGTTSLRTIETLYWMGLKAFLNKNSTIDALEVKQWDAYAVNSEKISAAQSLNALLAWMETHRLQKLVCRTQILIAPPYELKIASGIITNFHQPQSTLLLLIGAIVGEKWRDIYTYALQNNFRFLSYGDSSLLLK